MVGLSLSLDLNSVARPAGGGSPSFDYVINDDVDWASIPSSLLTDGGSIGINPAGTYTEQVFSMRPTSWLVFDTTVPGQFPRLPNADLRDCANLEFRAVEFVSAEWGLSARPAMQFRSLTAGAGIGAMRWRGSRITGNYRGDIWNGSNFDPDFDYPEYACIIPQFDNSGVVTSLAITQPFVGDLVADGVHNLTFTSPGSGITFTVSPVATMTVSGGVIVSTNLVSGGASTATTANNASTGILSKAISWAGQQPMLNYMPFGAQVISGTGFKSSGVVVGNLDFEDCTFTLTNNAFKAQVGNGGIRVYGCHFDMTYQDDLSFGVNQTDPEVIVEWNFYTRGMARIGDAGDPHKDMILQVFMNDLTVPYTPASRRKFRVRNNIAICNARGFGQPILMADAPLNVGFGGEVSGNIGLNLGSTIGINVESIDGLLAFDNLIMRFDPTDPANNQFVNIIMPSVTGAEALRIGDSVQGRNIADNFSTGLAGTGTLNRTQFPNLALGLNGATVPYTTVFPNFNGPKSTIAEVVAALTPAPAYAGFGPVRTGRDYINRTQTAGLVPNFVHFPVLTGQTTSTSVDTTWRRVIGPPGTVTFTCTNGQIQVADDAAGTNATTAAASGSFTLGYGDKFIRITGHLTAANGSTASVSNVTLNGTAYTFATTTAIVTSFPTADNQITARSTFAQPASNITGLSKLLVAFRFRWDSVVNNANIMANATAAPFRITGVTTSGGQWRPQILGSTIVGARFSTPLDTSFHTHIFAVDFTKTSPDDVAIWIQDQVRLAQASGGTYDTAGTRTFGIHDLFAGSPNAIGVFGESDGGGTLANGAMQWLWMSAYTAAQAMPDITDPLVQAAFSADRFGADGSTDLFGQPLYFYHGSVAEWNAGIPNKGSVASAPLALAAGTYA